MGQIKAPEKIYIGIVPSDLGNYKYTTVGKDFPDAIEYTRTDAFIEKACEFLSNKANIPLWEGYAHTFGCDTTKLVENFIKYMKGEVL